MSSGEVQCSMHGACSTRKIGEDNQVAALVQVYNDGMIERMQLDGLERSRSLGIGSQTINSLSVLSILPINDNIQPLQKARMKGCRTYHRFLVFAEADICKLSCRVPPIVAPGTGGILDKWCAAWPAGSLTIERRGRRVMIVSGWG